MNMYQAEYVQQTYNLSKHMGFYYELGAHKNLRYSMRAKTFSMPTCCFCVDAFSGFRDLYPGAPMCDCQHTRKRFVAGRDYEEAAVARFDRTLTSPCHPPRSSRPRPTLTPRRTCL